MRPPVDVQTGRAQRDPAVDRTRRGRTQVEIEPGRVAEPARRDRRSSGRDPTLSVATVVIASDNRGDLTVRQLDYEQTLSELMGFVGMVVAVSISAATTDFMGGTFLGRLRSATEADLSAMVPELEGDFAGETMYFMLVDPDGRPTGTFGIWRAGFVGGRRVEWTSGHTIALEVADLKIRIRPLKNMFAPLE